MRRATGASIALLLALGALSCAPTPPPTPDTSAASGPPPTHEVARSPEPVAVPSQQAPDLTPVPIDPRPPYEVYGGGEPQQRGTILLGTRDGDALDPYAAWPDGRFAVDAPLTYGAFWGEPVGAPEVRLTIYRVVDETLELASSVVVAVDPSAMGHLDHLPAIERPGTYRVEITRGPELLAWTLVVMDPACGESCAGG